MNLNLTDGQWIAMAIAGGSILIGWIIWILFGAHISTDGSRANRRLRAVDHEFDGLVLSNMAKAEEAEKKRLEERQKRLDDQLRKGGV